MEVSTTDRKQRGAWFTPEHLVDAVVAAVVDVDLVSRVGDRPLRVVDPACGDGRFLDAVRRAIEAQGGSVEAVGVDVDRATVAELEERHPAITAWCADALHCEQLDRRAGTFDLVIGNPPFLSQLAASTARGGSSRHGGGPYADAAVEFLSLGAQLADPNGGRLAFVLPQSILSARDAQPVRDAVDRRARMIWSMWTGERDFDADVVTCALAFEFGPHPDGAPAQPWSHVVTSRVGVPAMPAVFADVEPAVGHLGDRAWLNANFRDEYYGMIPAVGDHETGPRLITSGLIDPARNRWGERSVRFAKQRFAAPRLDVNELDRRMTLWAEKRLVPKVLVANQTPIVEAVADPDGDCLPGVPVVAVYPTLADTPVADVEQAVWEITAVLCSPAVSVWAWHQRGGSGLSSGAIRVGPTMLAELPWPTGDLGDAVRALREGDVVECGAAVDRAYGISSEEAEFCARWWRPRFDRVAARV